MFTPRIGGVYVIIALLFNASILTLILSGQTMVGSMVSISVLGSSLSLLHARNRVVILKKLT